MRFLGIDLAAQAANTAACVIERETGSSSYRVAAPELGLDDRGLLGEMARADWIAIDAPLGWPVGFADAVREYTDAFAWPEPVRTGKTLDYSGLRLRATDRQVTAWARDEDLRRCYPLSVSADSIGVVAFRVAGLLSAFRERCGWIGDRTGSLEQSRRVIEVYPAATLSFLELRAKGAPSYRGRTVEAVGERRRLLGGIETVSGFAIEDLAGQQDALVASDHGFDAFVAAVTAVLAQQRRTRLPGDDQNVSGRAQVEGWIHVPSGPASTP